TLLPYRGLACTTTGANLIGLTRSEVCVPNEAASFVPRRDSRSARALRSPYSFVAGRCRAAKATNNAAIVSPSFLVEGLIHDNPTFPDSTGLHPDRTVGGHRHHRHPHRSAGAGRPEGARGRRTCLVREQPQTAGPGRALLS